MRRLVAFAFLLALAAPAHSQTGELRSETLYVDAVPAKTGQALARMKAYVAATKAEPGLLAIRLLSELGRPERLAVYEVWYNQAALDAHLAAPARKGLDNQLVLLVQAPVDERLGSVVTSANPATISTLLHVLVHIDVAPPAAPAMTEALKAQVGKAGMAPGLLGYEVSVQSGRTNHFTVAQTWANRKAFEDFADWPAAKALRAEFNKGKGALYDERLYRAAP